MTPATEGFYDQQIMNSIPLGNYATVSRNSVGRSPTAFGGAAKSQTVSGQSRKLPAAGRGAFRKVGTVSAQFEAMLSRVILSTASTELSQSKNPDAVWKISQTASAKFGVAKKLDRRTSFGARRRAVKCSRSK